MNVAMMMERLSPRLRRLLALALLAVAVLTGLLLAYPAVGLFSRAEDEVETLRLAVRVAEAQAAVLPVLRQEVETQEQRVARAAGRLGSGSASMGVEMQNLVRDLSTRTGVDLRSAQPTPAEPAGPGLQSAGTRLQVMADMAELERFLRGLETQDPPITVKTLAIRPGRDDRLDVQLELTATVPGEDGP